MIQNQIISYARTAVMLGVGYLLTFIAAHFHIVISEHTHALVASLAAFVVAFAYYVAVRALEARWPKLGVLLGVPAEPHYPAIGATKPAGDKGAVAGALLIAVGIVLVAVLLGFAVNHWLFLLGFLLVVLFFV